MYEDWIYYSLVGELWKSSRDLSQKIRVFPEDGNFTYFCINPAGYIVKQKSLNNTNTVFYNVRRDSFDEFAGIPAGQLYKDKIITQEASLSGIQVYDLREGSLTTKYKGYVYDNAIIDNKVYFISEPSGENDKGFGNTIMWCDLDSGATGKAFSFDIKESIYGGETDYYEPQVFFNGRYIIVQNDINSFVYMNVDNNNPIKLVFEGKDVWAIYVPSDDNNLYFEVVHALSSSENQSVSPWEKSRSEYYQITPNTAEPVFLKDFRENLDVYSLYFTEGYLYYFGSYFYNNITNKDIRDIAKLEREKFY